MMNTTEYNSETTSMQTADYLPTDENGEPTYKSWDLFSPLYTLPELGDGETMHFDFWLNLFLLLTSKKLMQNQLSVKFQT